jgi:two-component system sensor histidine kinase DesK
MLKRFPNISMRWIGLLFCLGLTLSDTIHISGWETISTYSPLRTLILALAQHGYFVSFGVPLYLSVVLVLSLLFTAGYWWSTSDVIAPLHPRKMTVYFLLQVLVALLIHSKLFFVVLIQIALLRPRRSAFAYFFALLLLHLIIRILITLQFDYSGDPARMRNDYLSILGLMLANSVIFGLAYAFKEGYLARQALMSTLAHLQSTQILLQDSVRHAERSRIANDVHDNLGHHLTALNLHLDLAQRQMKLDQFNELTTALMTARALSQSVLSEVRNVVSGERVWQNGTVDLPTALRTLCAGIPAPHIQLHIQESLKVHSLQLAHHLFCCIQEAITNSIKHAHARNLKIDVSRNECGLSVRLSDDGCGYSEQDAVDGNGLRGMRERVQQLGGQLYVNRLSEHLSLTGFSLEIVVPYDGGVSFE